MFLRISKTVVIGWLISGLIGCQSSPKLEDTSFFLRRLHPPKESTPPRIKPLPPLRHVTTDQKYESKDCETHPVTEKVIRILRQTRNLTTSWPGFLVKDIKVVLTDGKFNRRSLLVNFEENQVKQMGLQAHKCQGFDKVLWVTNRPIPPRKDFMIIQCSTAKKGEEWDQYRCDFFPELQNLFETTGREIHFYDVQEHEQLLSELTKGTPYPLDAGAFFSSTVIHEYFHGWQEITNYHKATYNPDEPWVNYFEHCLTNESWLERLEQEKVLWKAIYKDFSSLDKEELKKRARQMITARNADSERKACWQELRIYERWEGVADYVALSMVQKAGVKNRELSYYALIVNGTENSYYASGMFWAFMLDRITGNSAWKLRVQAGVPPDLVLFDYLSTPTSSH